MIVVDLIDNKSKSLILFFAGWGHDEACVVHLKSSTHDVKVLYDFAELQPFDLSLLDGYDDITVVAWSFGVWSANELLQGVENRINRAIAINGTLMPIDDLNGIPEGIFYATLSSLTEASAKKFQMRVMGGVANYNQNIKYLPRRSFDNQKSELIWFSEQMVKPLKGNLLWNRALCGTKDAIFPFCNQSNFWGDKCESIDAPHFLFEKFEFWNDLIN